MSEEQDNRNHYSQLDGIRGIAILLVMILHFTILIPNNSLELLFVRMSQIGILGVDLFFVLSGFLITNILLRIKNQKNYFKNFYMRRVLRIFPAYFLVLFFCMVILPFLGSFINTIGVELSTYSDIKKTWFYYFTFTSNLLIFKYGKWLHPILDVSWSLSLEEQFYLIWSIIVYFLNNKTLKKACFILILTSLASRLTLMILGFNYIQIYVFPLSRVDMPIFGAYLALNNYQSNSLKDINTSISDTTKLLISSIILILLFTFAFGGYESPMLLTIGYSLIGWLFYMLLKLSLFIKKSSFMYKFLTSKILILLGKYSYVIYLTNFSIRGIVNNLILPKETLHDFPGGIIIGQSIFYAICFTLSLLIGFISWNTLEKYFLKLKRFF